MVVVVVAVRPGLSVGPLALFRQVAFRVIAVRPSAIVGHFISGPCRVTAGIAVAVQVVTVRVGGVAGDFVSGVVLISCRRAIEDFRAQTTCEVVSVGIVRQ